MNRGSGLTIRQVEEPPPGRECQGAGFGHFVPEDAKFQGKPIRFFLVTGNGIRKTVCEPCLVIANAMAQAKKRDRGF